MQYQLRAEHPEDEEFLFGLFTLTHGAPMAMLPPELIRMQFGAQRRHYRNQYPDAAFDILISEGHPVGRVCVDRNAERLQLVDIAILPSHQGRGLGTAVITNLKSEGLPVRLSVQQGNPARKLYDRLGFEVREDSGMFVKMEWRPPLPGTGAN